jgi:type VI protein secretion system component Hcp
MSKAPRQHVEPDRSQRAAPTAVRASGAAAKHVLALQRGAGNRAVAALLARDKKAPAKPPAKPPPKLEDGVWAVVPEVGTIRLRSAQFGIRRAMTSPTGRGTAREAEPQAPPELVVTSDLGDHSDKIFQAAMGGSLGTVEIRFVKGGKAYMTVKLISTLVTSYSVSGHGGGTSGDHPVESWTLSASKIAYETDQTSSESTSTEWNLTPLTGS